MQIIVLYRCSPPNMLAATYFIASVSSLKSFESPAVPKVVNDLATNDGLAVPAAL
jgi:hypothetical protein